MRAVLRVTKISGHASDEAYLAEIRQRRIVIGDITEDEHGTLIDNQSHDTLGHLFGFSLLSEEMWNVLQTKAGLLLESARYIRELNQKAPSPQYQSALAAIETMMSRIVRGQDSGSAGISMFLDFQSFGMNIRLAGENPERGGKVGYFLEQLFDVQDNPLSLESELLGKLKDF